MNKFSTLIDYQTSYCMSSLLHISQEITQLNQFNLQDHSPHSSNNAAENYHIIRNKNNEIRSKISNIVNVLNDRIEYFSSENRFTD